MNHKYLTSYFFKFQSLSLFNFNFFFFDLYIQNNLFFIKDSPFLKESPSNFESSTISPAISLERTISIRLETITLTLEVKSLFAYKEEVTK